MQGTEDGSATELAIPVQLDEDRLAIVARALRSSRILGFACPMRKFGVVIGFQHTNPNAGFSIIHRGGVTASKPLSIVEEQGQKDVQRVSLSILAWRSDEILGSQSSSAMVSLSTFSLEHAVRGTMRGKIYPVVGKCNGERNSPVPMEI